MESKQKRTALVTGGSSGIGRCTAVALSKAGYIVYEFSRRDVPVEGVRHMRVDVTDEASVQEAVGQILLERESIEILVNCAGFGISGAVEFTESEQAKAQFNVNFFGTVNVSRAVLPCADSTVDILSISVLWQQWHTFRFRHFILPVKQQCLLIPVRLTMR